MKRITNKRTMTRVANQIESEVKKAVGIFSSTPTVERGLTERYGLNFIRINVYNERTYMLTIAELQQVQDALKPFLDKYDSSSIYYYFETTSIWSDKIEKFLPAPSIVITIKYQ